MGENIKIIVIKKDGKKVDFNSGKIAVTIKKAFDNQKKEDGNQKYSEKDCNKIYNKVIENIEEKKQDKIKTEEIKKIIEETFKTNQYIDIYKSLQNPYKRKKYKFTKSIENTNLENIIDGEKSKPSMNVIIKSGQLFSSEYSKSHLIKRKYIDLNESKIIHINDLEYYLPGTVSSCNVDLSKLFKEGFQVGEAYFKEPNNIMTYQVLSSIALQAIQNELHGEIAIPALDYYFAPGVVKTFKNEFRRVLHDFLDYTDLGIFVAVNGMEREIDKISTIDFDISIFNSYCRKSETVKRLLKMTYKKALENTNSEVYKAMEAFVYNLNTVGSNVDHVSPNVTVNIGTDKSKEGRIITKNFLLAMNAGIGTKKLPKYPKVIFKIKDGINYNRQDPNYDLLELACKINSEKMSLSFSFLDTKYNKIGFKEKEPLSEVTYTNSSIRVYENVPDGEKSTSVGRGNLSTTTINLPRISIESDGDIRKFYKKLDEIIDLVIIQLLERFEYQSLKRVYNFPFIIKQGIWMNGEKLKANDKLRRVNKYGTLSIGIIGLAEALTELTGNHHGQSDSSQKIGIAIIKHIKSKVDEYSKENNITFNLSTTCDEKILKECMELDRIMYGKIKGVTDKDKYTPGFMIPDDFEISFEDKISIESKYHILFLGGHKISIEIDKKSIGDKKLQMDLIKKMKESDIGYCEFILNKKL